MRCFYCRLAAALSLAVQFVIVLPPGPRCPLSRLPKISAAGEEYLRSTKALLLRASLMKHDLIQASGWLCMNAWSAWAALRHRGRCSCASTASRQHFCIFFPLGVGGCGRAEDEGVACTDGMSKHPVGVQCQQGYLGAALGSALGGHEHTVYPS